MPQTRPLYSVACAFVDIMGQKAELKRFDRFRLGPELENDPEFLELVDKTIRRVDRLHDGIFSFYDEFRKSGGTNVPPAHREYWKAITSIDPQLVPFSDGFYISVPLVHDREILPIFGIAGMLHSLCMTMLTQFATGTPVRGGADIGSEMQLRPPNVLYGSGIAKSYELENSTAVYPRIVVGADLVNYIEMMGKMSPADAQQVPHVTNSALYAQLTSSLARLCDEMLIGDFDGNRIVHYLSPYTLGLLDQEARRILIEPARSFIVEQANAAQAAHNTKLGIKYSLLMQYYDDFSGEQ